MSCDGVKEWRLNSSYGEKSKIRAGLEGLPRPRDSDASGKARSPASWSRSGQKGGFKTWDYAELPGRTGSNTAGRYAPPGRTAPAPQRSSRKLLRALQLLAERLAVYAEYLGRARLVAPDAGQNIADMLGLHLGEGPVEP